MMRSCVLVSAALVSSLALALPVQAADNVPLKAGFMTVKSGALAAGGRQMEEGLSCV